jgi:hypothetical protein
MNGDGNPDLVIANHQTPYVTVLLGDGKGGYKPSAHSPFATKSYPHPHGVVVGDFMGVGKPAVVTDSWGNREILLIPTDGKGNLILPGRFFAADLHTDSGVRAADFNKDGNLDVVTVSQGTGTVGLLLGDGKEAFRKAPGSPFPAGDTPWMLAIGDVTGDGNADVAVIPYERDIRDRRKLGVTEGLKTFPCCHPSSARINPCPFAAPPSPKHGVFTQALVPNPGLFVLFVARD